MGNDTVWILVEESSSTSSAACKRAFRRRTTREAGRALEKLGHAIEYLSDELVDKCPTLSANNEQVQAIQILMALNRQVYFECPLVPTFGEWARSHLLRSSGQAGKSREKECRSSPQAAQRPGQSGF
jgi:hypothetical protein